jgi:hypothetical protein
MNHFSSYQSLPQKGKVARLALLIPFLMVLLCSQPVRAQEGNEADSTIPIESPIEEEPVTGYEKTVLPEPLVYRDVPDSVTRKLKKQKEFAYANDPRYWANEPQHEEERDFWAGFYQFFESVTVRTIAYSLLIAFFLFIIYRIIVVNKLFLFYSSKKVKHHEQEEALNIEDEKLDEKIQKTTDEKNYRMAVRYMYLKALQLLNEKQWIHFHAEATNDEYVNQLRGHKLGTEFGFLTRVYDYVWYGEFTLTDEQFNIVNNNFRQFYKGVNS